MKKLKLTDKGKKLIGVLAAIASLLIIILVFILISATRDTSKTYDVEKLHNILIGEYEDINLKEMDQIDLLNAFGINIDEIPSSTLLMSMNEESEEPYTSKDNYIIIINTENYQYYYDALYSQIDSITRYGEDEELVNLYSKAIVKCGENYVYMIVSEYAQEIEKIINE